jgi:AbrB family looped-hinge helix DNA binding protein
VGKVTTKLQVTVPKAVADHFAIRPGDEVEWSIAGEVIRVIPRTARSSMAPPQDGTRRLALFDAATARQKRRERSTRAAARRPKSRGWSRNDLYDRGRAD